MKTHALCQMYLAVIFSMLTLTQVQAAAIKVAAASNFGSTMRQLVIAFEKKSEHRVILTVGSTGKLYSQIIHGAPFDIFFAADNRRPKQLEKKGRGLAGSRFTYAIGSIVLWSQQPHLVDAQGLVLSERSSRLLALAHPRLAPYGIAAEQVLRRLGVWSQWKKRLAMGENVSQAFQFVASGNASMGFISRTQLLGLDEGDQGSHWIPPRHLYEPIEQQAILLRDDEPVRAFAAFVQGQPGREIIRQNGYADF